MGKYPNDYQRTRWGVCTLCGKDTLVSDHHIYPQTNDNKRLYPEFIHRADNLIKSVCSNTQCHNSLKNQTEKEFCTERKIRPRSKSGMLIYLRDPWETIEEV